MRHHRPVGFVINDWYTVKMNTSTPSNEILDERFWSKVKKTKGCWLWQGAKHTRSGHGMFGYSVMYKNTTLYAHRYAYERLVGSIPRGMVLDHICCVTNCVNPKHLEIVTRGENTVRAGKRMIYCKRGHLLEETAYINKKNGHRTCRACNNYRRRKK